MVPAAKTHLRVDGVSDGGIQFITPTPSFILPENADIPQNSIVRTMTLNTAKQQAPGNPAVAPLKDSESADHHTGDGDGCSAISFDYR